MESLSRLNALRPIHATKPRFTAIGLKLKPDNLLRTLRLASHEYSSAWVVVSPPKAVPFGMIETGHYFEVGRSPIMKGKRFTEEQIAFALRQAESGVPVVEICRKMEVSEATFYRWKKKTASSNNWWPICRWTSTCSRMY